MNNAQRNKIESDLEHIRTIYDVPAKLGGKIEYKWRSGTIVGVKGQYLRALLDGEREIKLYHPTLNMKYL